MSDIPFMAIGHDELKDSPNIAKGDTIEHRHPDGTWEAAKIYFGERVNPDGSREEDSHLAIYTLKNGQAYLAGIEGKMLAGAGLRKVEPRPEEKDPNARG